MPFPVIHGNISLMENNIFSFSEDETAEFKRRSIAALVLFGSQAQDMAGPASDFDIGVIVSDRKVLLDELARKTIYDYLYDLLAPKIKKLVNIDIVFLETSPAELRAHVMKYGQPLYESRPGVFADFRAKTIEQYADFAPLRAIFEGGVLSRIR